MPTEDDILYTDDPQFSSAALCIEVQIGGDNDEAAEDLKDGRQKRKSSEEPMLEKREGSRSSSWFRPVYTHQCFHKEWIRGYRPYSEFLMKSSGQDNMPTRWHGSYSYHENALHELKISVRLAPSCMFCTITLQTQAAREIMVLPPRQAKRLREDEHDADEDIELGSEDTEDESDDDDDDDEEASDIDNDEEENEEDQEGTTRNRRMPRDEIISSLSKALPPILSHNNHLTDLTSHHDYYLRQPVGKILRGYDRKMRTFVLSLADGRTAAKYHQAVQNLAIFFIETADNVNVAEIDKGGFWRVMYLFEKLGDSQYALAGYMTLFHFDSPFRKPMPGTILRVCQALILPPFQRAGHGSDMLHTLYDLVQFPGKIDYSDNHGSLHSIVEINVEDPAPSFVQLRNRVDYERCQNDAYFATYDHMAGCRVLPDETVSKIAGVYKITTQQVHIVSELAILCAIINDQNRCFPPENSEELKPFRLMVKRRLNKAHREELGSCITKDEMKRQLAELFHDQIEQYKSILKSASRNNVA